MPELFTPKQRMLNAYRGVFSDRYPVAPEFWYYYPARVLGVSMVEFEREIPFWQALQATFKRYGTEGWGAAFLDVINPDAERKIRFLKLPDDQYRETVFIRFHGKEFQSSKRYSLKEPSWVETPFVKDEKELDDYINIILSPQNAVDFTSVNTAYAGVGEDYLLEMWLGNPFFDTIAELMGFEKGVMYFMSEDECHLESLRRQLIEYQKELIHRVVENTAYESFVIGCSYSNNSLLGPTLWRKWDKPYLQAMAGEIHRHGKLLHIHFHGRCLETVPDFAEIGIDCVCPFERPPGGDVVGLDGLKKVREMLADRVTMNGNVHTVETLIRGTESDVKREVREIKTAFRGSARLIIGTGDQVGLETPEGNVWAMVDEAIKTGD